MTSAETNIRPEDLTIVIEGWNAHDLESRAAFETSLQSLRQQSFPLEGARVVVVIDAEVAAEDLQWISQLWPAAEVVPLENATYYRTKNHALRSADSPYVALVDSDVDYSRTWLENMVAAIRPDVPFVVGDTAYAAGFLHRTLDLIDWVSKRNQSGFTDSFYANNLLIPRQLYRRIEFREDFGTSGGGASDVLRSELIAEGTLPWYAAEAKGIHDLPPFLKKRLRVGAFQIHYRRLAEQMPWAWLARLGWLSPVPVIGATTLKAWQRTWRLRSSLPLRGWSLPYFITLIGLVKLFELAGAFAYVIAPGWLGQRTGWFETPPASLANRPSSKPAET